MSHDLKAFEQLLVRERDGERERYTAAIVREKAGDHHATFQRGIAFGAATSYELALDVLHTFTEGEFGQKLAEQRSTAPTDEREHA